MDQGRTVLTEVAREVDAERAQREAFQQRIADRVLALKQVTIEAERKAIRETAEHFAAAFVGAMRL